MVRKIMQTCITNALLSKRWDKITTPPRTDGSTGNMDLCTHMELCIHLRRSSQKLDMSFHIISRGKPVLTTAPKTTSFLQPKQPKAKNWACTARFLLMLLAFGAPNVSLLSESFVASYTVCKSKQEGLIRPTTKPVIWTEILVVVTAQAMFSCLVLRRRAPVCMLPGCSTL